MTIKLLSVLAALALALPLAAPAQASTAKTRSAASKTAAAKKPAARKAPAKRTAARKATAVRAVEATTPVESPSRRLTDNELLLAQSVYTGNIACELGASIDVTPDPANPGFFNVKSGGRSYYMHPVESKTGAMRLEDGRAGAVWLQLGNKSMLMDQKQGKRVADDCKAPAQVEFAEAMRQRPAGPGLFDAPQPPAAAMAPVAPLTPSMPAPH